MAKEDQFSVLHELLRRFEKEGVLDDVMLIGSWCLFFYRESLQKMGSIPAIRTLDADFLIPNQREITHEVDVPALLNDMGFVPTYYRSSALVVYDHPELRVEFLVPEVGKGSAKAKEIKKLHVNAEGLRYMNLLADYPKDIFYKGLKIRVPEPAAFALHKLIVSARRKNKEKARKDLNAAVVLFDWIFSLPKEKTKLKKILKSLPKAWLKTVRELTKKHSLLHVQLLTDKLDKI